MKKQISKYFSVKSLMHIVMLAALSLSLIWQSGCVTSGVQKDGGMGLSKDGTPLKDDGINKLVLKKGVKKIIIPSFQVIFLTKKGGTAQSKGNLFASSDDPKAQASMVVEWNNVDKSMLQKAADAAYAEFVQKLAASGIEVLPMSSVTGSGAYKKLNGSSAPVEGDAIIVMSPTGMKIYDPQAKLDPNGAFTLGLFNLNSKGEGDIIKELNGNLDDVAVARVSIVDNFGTFKKEGKVTGTSGPGGVRTATASIAFNPELTIIPGLSVGMSNYSTSITISKYYVMEGYKISGIIPNPKDTYSAWLQSDISSGIVAGSLREIGLTTGEKTGAAAVNLLGALTGQGKASFSRYEFIVNSADYEQGTKEAAGKFAEMIAAKIQTAK